MKFNRIVIEHIEKLGGVWKSTKDGAFWETEANGFVLHAWPFLNDAPGRPLRLGFDCAFSHKAFARVANLIMGDKPKSFVSLGPFQKSVLVNSPEEIDAAMLGLMVELINELREKNIDYLIEEFRVNRPDRPSMPQINHLAALAWAKDVDTLEDYQRIFAAGGHLNFVPMIDKAMIDRALKIGQTQAENY